MIFETPCVVTRVHFCKEFSAIWSIEKILVLLLCRPGLSMCENRLLACLLYFSLPVLIRYS
jgi:hypothetical protein